MFDQPLQSAQDAATSRAYSNLLAACSMRFAGALSKRCWRAHCTSVLRLCQHIFCLLLLEVQILLATAIASCRVWVRNELVDPGRSAITALAAQRCRCTRRQSPVLDSALTVLKARLAKPWGTHLGGEGASASIACTVRAAPLRAAHVQAAAYMLSLHAVSALVGQ